LCAPFQRVARQSAFPLICLTRPLAPRRASGVFAWAIVCAEMRVLEGVRFGSRQVCTHRHALASEPLECLKTYQTINKLGLSCTPRRRLGR